MTLNFVWGEIVGGGLVHIRIICFHNPWYITDAGVPALLQGLYQALFSMLLFRLNTRVNTQERWGGALECYLHISNLHVVICWQVSPTHLCLWSRCSKHSCIAPAWTSADEDRELFGLDQHPSTCKPGHLSPSHLKIENCENGEERGRLGVTTLISSHLCVQSVWQFYLRFDSWRMN